MTAAAALDVKRVLVADDELNMRRVLEAMLRREGYDVITAANGVEAMGGMGTKGGVHTVITDLKMPGLDGMGLLKRLTAEYPDVPVVMITAHGSVESAVEAVKLGAFDYLEKPFEQEQIRQVVAKALNTYALARRDARAMSHANGTTSIPLAAHHAKPPNATVIAAAPNPAARPASRSVSWAVSYASAPSAANESAQAAHTIASSLAPSAQNGARTAGQSKLVAPEVIGSPAWNRIGWPSAIARAYWK